MTQVPATMRRADPYKSFRFRVRMDGRLVAGAKSVSALKRTTDVVSRRTADPTGAQAGDGRFEAITLEHGLTVDAAFHQWATSGTPPTDVDLEVYNEAGQLVTAYTVDQAWVSQYQGLPALDANATMVAFEHLRLENQGWQRREIRVEPAEPHFPPPEATGDRAPAAGATPRALWARLSERLMRLLRRR